MKLFKIIPFLLIVFSVSCTSYIAHIRSDAVPAKFTKEDSICVEIPEQASAIEQRTAQVVKEELIENGFNYDEENPKLRMMVTVNRQITNYGYNANSFAVAPGIVTSTATPHNIDEAFLRLSVYFADDPQKLAVWDVATKTREDMFRYYIHSVVQLSLNQFGNSYNQWDRLDTGYKVVY